MTGSYTAEQHQEVIISLQNETFVRISRTNGSDTFQVCVTEEEIEWVEQFELPTLKSFDTTRKGLTLKDVKAAYDEVYAAIPRYDQGNCQALSQMIIEALVPGSFPSELDW